MTLQANRNLKVKYFKIQTHSVHNTTTVMLSYFNPIHSKILPTTHAIPITTNMHAQVNTHVRSFILFTTRMVGKNCGMNWNKIAWNVETYFVATV